MGGVRGGKDGGYVLLDALAALCIVLIGFAVFLGGLALAGRTARRGLDSAQEAVERRNAHDRQRPAAYGER